MAGRAPVLSRRHSISPPSARSLLLTVLGELVLPQGRPVWTSALLHVLGGLDIEEKSGRQAIARTAADGWITSARDGRRVCWMLTPTGQILLSEGAARIYGTAGSQLGWDRSWLVVLASVPETRRKLRHQLQTRLAWAGMGNPDPGLWVSTHQDRAAEVERIMRDLGLASGALCFRGPFGPIGDEAALVSRAWDLDEIAGAYRAFLAEFASLDPEPGDPTVHAQIRLVHAWRRFPFLDPQLPAVLLPANWIGHAARARFDELHTAWSAEAARRWSELTAA